MTVDLQFYQPVVEAMPHLEKALRSKARQGAKRHLETKISQPLVHEAKQETYMAAIMEQDA